MHKIIFLNYLKSFVLFILFLIFAIGRLLLLMLRYTHQRRILSVSSIEVKTFWQVSLDMVKTFWLVGLEIFVNILPYCLQQSKRFDRPRNLFSIFVPIIYIDQNVLTGLETFLRILKTWHLTFYDKTLSFVKIYVVL